jgi:hypothetical protein
MDHAAGHRVENRNDTPAFGTIALRFWSRSPSLRGLRELLESGRRATVGLAEGGAEMTVARES